MDILTSSLFFFHHCLKYARVQVFYDWHFPAIYNFVFIMENTGWGKRIFWDILCSGTRMSKDILYDYWVNTNLGLFNNYVTLKLPFFNPPTPHHYASSRMIAKLHLRHAWHIKPLYHLFLFFEVEKNPKINTRLMIDPPMLLSN